MSAGFRPSGMISLTTDFGIGSPFVGVMKAAVLARFPQANIVDLFHEAAAFDPIEGGFWLGRGFRYFPAGTVHVAVVDPGVGSERRIVVAEADGHVFLAPDNGLLDQALGGLGAVVYRYLDEAGLMECLQLPAPSRTFHGRDLFAPAAAALAAGDCTPAQLGHSVPSILAGERARAVAGEQRLAGVVVSVDSFGNLISNIERRQLRAFRSPVVECGGHRLPLRDTYSEVQAGELLALVNAFDVVEVARNQGNAGAYLRLGRGAAITVQEETV